MEEQKKIEPDGSVVTKSSKGGIYTLSIIGQIEGHYISGEGQKATKYEHIIPLLGDVEAGLALAEMIASMKKPTVSLVLGGGHSIGVPLATSAKRSFIVPSATMTLHPVRINGLVLGAPQTFHYFDEMQSRIIKFICAHSKATPEKIRELMMRPDELATDVGSIIDGDEAVRYGIIDRVGGLSDAIECLKGQKEC